MWNEWYEILQDPEKRNKPKRKELRDKWCKCCNELSEMVHQEYLTNPRYNNLKM
jgi:hypothetical protein